ncbi:hypothetical protein WA026_011018 [Henosepilachna vigintioctopunctata]|uniref:Solute-binding protein family 3/N-terminal domain-containing protein n=1 Tax=Henosepilachna vigintioctopunctata TaxID=420089 RepID=A0AAW1UWM5_9CUCU
MILLFNITHLRKANNTIIYRLFVMLLPVKTYSNLVFSCVNTLIMYHVLENDLVVYIGEYSISYPSIRIHNIQKLKYNFFPQRPKFFIIEIGAHENLTEILKVLVKQKYTEPRATFLIIEEKLHKENVEYLFPFFIFNIIVLDSSNGELFTFVRERNKYGVDSINCQSLESKENSYPRKISREYASKIIEFDSLKICFTDGSEPYAMFSPDGTPEGVEIDIMSFITDKLSIRRKYVNIQDRQNVISYIYKNECDVVIGNRGMGRVDTDVFMLDFTVHYTFDYVYWLVPVPDLIPRYQYFLKAFSPDIWIAWMASLICICSFWNISDVVLYSRKRFSHLVRKLFVGFILFTEQNYKPDKKYLSDTCRLMVILMIFLMFMLGALFKSKFNYFLTGLNYQDAIKNIDDIIQRNLKIGCVPELVEFLLEFPADYKRENLVICDAGVACLNRSAFQKDIAILRPLRRVLYYREIHTDENMRWLFNKIHPAILSGHNCAVFKAGHPLFDIIDRHIWYMLETGWINRIMKKYEKNSDVVTILITAKRMEMGHISTPFFIWFLGMFSSLFVLLYEIYSNKHISVMKTYQ